MKDYSEWLTPERLAEEERIWNTTEGSANVTLAATRANELIRTYALTSVVEYGCGPGHLAVQLQPTVDYTGFDANPMCLELAKNRCRLTRPLHQFRLGDVRDEKTSMEADLVICHAFLKHFATHEWETIARKVFSCGKWGVVSVPIFTTEGKGQSMVDDGVEFHHTWVEVGYIRSLLADMAKYIVEILTDDEIIETMSRDDVPSIKGRRALISFGPR